MPTLRDMLTPEVAEGLERCESCDAAIGGTKTCVHCGWVRPTAEQRSNDKLRMAVAIVLTLLVMIIAIAVGISRL